MYAESPEFERLVAGVDRVDLARSSLEIARDADPDLEIDRYLARIADFADRARNRLPERAGPLRALAQIHWVLYVEEGFKGADTDYYDFRNCYLNHLIDRRVGMPITLCVLFKAVADRLGVETAGVNFPSHFMLRTGSDDDLKFIDAYESGVPLDREECRKRLSTRLGRSIVLDDRLVAPCSHATIILRVLTNLKLIYVNRGDYASALPVLERIARLVPDIPEAHRDLGIAYFQLGRYGAAIDPIDRYLKANPNSAGNEPLKEFLHVAWAKTAQDN